MVPSEEVQSYKERCQEESEMCLTCGRFQYLETRGQAEGKSKRTEEERQLAWVQGTVVKSILWKHRLRGRLEGRINWKGWLEIRQRKALNAQQGCVCLTQLGMGSLSRSPGSDITRCKLRLVDSNEAAVIR